MEGDKNSGMTGDRALQRLTEGNRRFAGSMMSHPRQARAHREGLQAAQSPFAVILGCSDSRVPPEILFDQGLGDLFVVRVAGNVIGKFVLASIEYAAKHLHTPLIMVLGHSGCGAVHAVIEGEPLPGHLSMLPEALRPALDSIEGRPENHADEVAMANARITARLLREDQALSDLVHSEALKVVPAFYSLETGEVEVLS